MDIQEKLEILKRLDTKSLIEKLHEYEGELEKALQDQADFTSQNYEYVAGRGSDCSRIKEIVAGLSMQVPETNEAGKKTTAPEKEAWLLLQRHSSQELIDAIARQREVAFLADDFQIKCEMAKKRLEGIRAVLGLKTAQINFLSGD